MSYTYSDLMLDRIAEITRCPRCKHVLSIDRELYGDDADGNRGMWRTVIECNHCEWTPVDGYDFPEYQCTDCGVGSDDEDDFRTLDGDLLCLKCVEKAEVPIKRDEPIDMAAMVGAMLGVAK